MKRAEKTDLVFENLGDFSLKNTLDCGQCFRWVRQKDGAYFGVVGCSFVEVRQQGEQLRLKEVFGEKLGFEFWQSYFGLDKDYEAIDSRVKKDPILKESYEFSPGIRILKQDPWEALISFIISQNNNIPRIKKIIEALAELAGPKLGPGVFGFPTPEQILKQSKEELGGIKSGFRAEYIMDAARLAADGVVDLNAVAKQPNAEALECLMKIKGVGPKVGACVLLYGFGRLEVVPVDVWIKRGLKSYFKNGWPKQVEGIEGVGAQYFYNYLRQGKLGFEG